MTRLPLLTIYTVAEAAAQLGCHPAYVRRLCAEADAAGAPIGVRKSERIRLLTARDISRLREIVRAPGNPQFGPDFRPRRKKYRKKSSS